MQYSVVLAKVVVVVVLLPVLVIALVKIVVVARRRHVRQLLLEVADDFTLSGGGEGVAALGQELHHVVGQVKSKQDGLAFVELGTVCEKPSGSLEPRVHFDLYYRDLDVNIMCF